MDYYKQLIIDLMKDKVFLSGLFLELFKAFVAFGFGYFSFKTFERYKNKKDNNKLYISLIKLESELLENKRKIQDLINDHELITTLLEKFNIDRKFNDKLYELYKDIYNLNIYTSIDYLRDENGDIIDCIEYYEDKPYRLIDEIGSEIYYCEDEDIIENMEKQIEHYSKLNIYTEFEGIYKRVCILSEKDSMMKKGLIFLKEKLEKYNKLSLEDKKKYLQTFCELIIEKENDFTETLDTYREINTKQMTLRVSEKITLKFDKWNTTDVNILALYDADSYISIEELYNELSTIDINKNDIKSLKDAQMGMDKLLKQLVKHKKKLKKILTKNNRYFKDV